MTNEIKVSNILPLYPNGLPEDVFHRLKSVYGDKDPEEVYVRNESLGFTSPINLKQEREYLHLTLDNTLEALAHMSAYQKYETFKGLAESMKTTFDLYMAEKTKGKL